jgi:hypothetical protein
MEAYLDDKTFESLFKMKKIAFYAQPQWKRTAKKKELGLF